MTEPAHTPRSHGLVGIIYWSSRYAPRGGGPNGESEELFDEPYEEPDEDEPTTSLFALARQDLFNNPAWKAWLKEYMARDDVDIYFRVDDIPKGKVTRRSSKPKSLHSFTCWIPADALLTGDERAAWRAAHCHLYRTMARTFEVPEPPPRPVTDASNETRCVRRRTRHVGAVKPINRRRLRPPTHRR